MLSDQHKLFCENYIINFNATEAAKKAGFSEKTARSQASRLLSRVDIQEYISELVQKRSKRAKVSADDVINELAAIAFCDTSEFYCDITGELLQPHELEGNARKAVNSFKSLKTQKFSKDGEQKGRTVETIDEYKRHDKMKALELLGKHLGIYELDNKQKNQNITVNLSDSDAEI